LISYFITYMEFIIKSIGIMNIKTSIWKLIRISSSLFLLWSMLLSCSDREELVPATNHTPISNLTMLSGQTWILYQSHWVSGY